MACNSITFFGADKMSDIELIQPKVMEDPGIMELKRKLNEIIRDVNHINQIVTANNLSIKLLKRDHKNLQKLITNIFNHSQ